MEYWSDQNYTYALTINDNTIFLWEDTSLTSCINYVKWFTSSHWCFGFCIYMHELSFCWLWSLDDKHTQQHIRFKANSLLLIIRAAGWYWDITRGPFYHTFSIIQCTSPRCSTYSVPLHHSTPVILINSPTDEP